MAPGTAALLFLVNRNTAPTVKAQPHAKIATNNAFFHPPRLQEDEVETCVAALLGVGEGEGTPVVGEGEAGGVSTGEGDGEGRATEEGEGESGLLVGVVVGVLVIVLDPDVDDELSSQLAVHIEPYALARSIKRPLDAPVKAATTTQSGVHSWTNRRLPNAMLSSAATQERRCLKMMRRTALATQTLTHEDERQVQRCAAEQEWNSGSIFLSARISTAHTEILIPTLSHYVLLLVNYSSLKTL
ncbi:hypothetical protein FI667_g9469, partial [Globisporangium splendens]